MKLFRLLQVCRNIHVGHHLFLPACEVVFWGLVNAYLQLQKHHKNTTTSKPTSRLGGKLPFYSLFNIII